VLILRSPPNCAVLLVTGTNPLGANDQYGRPTQTAANVGSRFYDGTAFSFQNASPDPSTQGWMTQLDNTPAFDFLLPK